MQVQSGTVGFFQLPNMLLLADVHQGLQTTPLRKAQWVPAHETRRAEGIDRRFAALFVVIIAGVFRSVSDARHQRSKRRPSTPFEGSA